MSIKLSLHPQLLSMCWSMLRRDIAMWTSLKKIALQMTRFVIFTVWLYLIHGDWIWFWAIDVSTDFFTYMPHSTKRVFAFVVMLTRSAEGFVMSHLCHYWFCGCYQTRHISLLVRVTLGIGAHFCDVCIYVCTCLAVMLRTISFSQSHHVHEQSMN